MFFFCYKANFDATAALAATRTKPQKLDGVRVFNGKELIEL